jgi:hypothetical protein
MVNYKKITAIIIIVMVFSCIFLWGYLENHYAYTRPEKPQPELGRVYRLNVHGTIVFLTKQENSQLQWLFYGGAFFVIIAFIYNYYFDPFD